MKVSKVELTEYKQFKDLTLDLTYPKGHKKEGQPLDKICIIGQSGTGKTNLLEVIRDKLYTNEVKAEIVRDEESDSEEVYFKGTELNSFNQDIEMSEKDKLSLAKMKDISHKILIEDNGNYETRIMEHQNLLSASKEIESRYINQKINDIKQNYITIDETAWVLLKDKIDNYSEENERISAKLFREVKAKIKNMEEAIQEEEEWKAQNENILENISKILNEILNKFNLKLHPIDKNQKSYNDLTIKDLSNGKIIEYDKLSTGTKNIISTFIPLKIHNPKDSIILIDEPENSFYPDIQRMLTELYMEVGENNQLIMATHSPLIASSFEPWEVVELEFDENTHQVYRELYFEGERHIDNYFKNPQLLTWTSILTNIFDVKEKSNFLVREDKLMEYATLKAQIKTIENREEKIEKVNELKKLSKLLGLENNETNI